MELKQKLDELAKRRKTKTKERETLLTTLEKALLAAVETYQADDKATVEALNEINRLHRQYEDALDEQKNLAKRVKKMDKEAASQAFFLGAPGMPGPQGPCGPQGVQGQAAWGGGGGGGTGYRSPETRTQLIRDKEKQLLRQITLNKLIGQLIRFVTDDSYVTERLEEKIFASDAE